MPGKRFQKKDWPDLPKWPGLLVVGDKVTKKQAEEIIIRTDNLYFFTNDKKFALSLYKAMGITKLDENFGWPTDEGLKMLEQAKKSVGWLGLTYMENNQIVSSFIFGPHGWCSWDGTIGSNSFNIGKWPSCTEVHEDLKKIAKAFPYLNMKVQLLDSETLDESAEPIIEWEVCNSKVKAVKPEAPITTPKEPDYESHLKKLLDSCQAERGCTLKKFEEVFNRLKNR